VKIALHNITNRLASKPTNFSALRAVMLAILLYFHIKTTTTALQGDLLSEIINPKFKFLQTSPAFSC